MSDPATTTIELPKDLLAFGEERVRTGNGASVADVVREAVEEKRDAVLRAALDEGIADLGAAWRVPLRSSWLGSLRRHIRYYRIRDTATAEVVRFLHDAMDLAGHLP